MSGWTGGLVRGVGLACDRVASALLIGLVIIYNVAANRSRLRGALKAMCRTPVCEEPT